MGNRNCEANLRASVTPTFEASRMVAFPKGKHLEGRESYHAKESS